MTRSVTVLFGVLSALGSLVHHGIQLAVSVWIKVVWQDEIGCLRCEVSLLIH